MRGNTCELCPKSTYQPERGAQHCIPCGVGLTTAGPGAVSPMQCHSGPVDECALGTHQCSEHATCVDTEQEYYCLCETGYTGDGINCTGMSSFICEGVWVGGVCVCVCVCVCMCVCVMTVVMSGHDCGYECGCGCFFNCLYGCGMTGCIYD